MKKSRHSEDEILTLLDEARRGIPVESICATAHISERTFYRWKKRLDGVTPNGLDRVVKLEREIARLKRQLSMRDRVDPASLSKDPRRSAPSRPDIGGPFVGANGDRSQGARTGRFSHIRAGR